MPPDENRTQPEFSPGERLARLEAEITGLGDEKDELQKQMDRRFKQEQELFDQKLWGLGERLAAINNAQKEAIEKSEEATQRTLQAIQDGIERTRKENSESSDRYRKEVAERLATLERGDTSHRSEKEAIVGLQNRQIALVGSLAIVVTAIIALISSHPFG